MESQQNPQSKRSKHDKPYHEPGFFRGFFPVRPFPFKKPYQSRKKYQIKHTDYKQKQPCVLRRFYGNVSGVRIPIAFVIFFVIIRLIPEIGKYTFRDCIGSGKRYMIKNCTAFAFSAVSADTGKNSNLMLLRPCFTVILDFLPFAFRIIQFFTECVDAFNAQISPVPECNIFCSNITAETVHGLRFDLDGLCIPGVIPGCISYLHSI